MDFKNPFVIIFIAGTLFKFLLDTILEFIDYKFRQKHGLEIPQELEGLVDEPTLKKTCAYENANYFSGIPYSLLGLALTFALVFSLYFVFCYEKGLSIAKGNSYLTILLFALFVSIPSIILSIPFELYDEFKIEKKFGFSNMTLGMWLLDQLKSLVIGLVLGVPLILVAVALMNHIEHWWFFLGSVYIAFSLAVSYIYPVLIAPIFNKFTPLEDGELRERLFALLEKCGFKASGIFVMDASRRSSHSNAYFTGFGKNKRIVLYDTLLKQLSTDEIEAVLGHELGHFKKHHIIKRMCVMFPLIFAFLFAAWLLIKIPSLYSGFGFAGSTGSISSTPLSASNTAIPATLQYVGIYLLSLIFGGFSPIFSLVSNTFSRRDEFEADKFSVATCGSGEPLVSALIKLNKENLSEIQVPTIYSIFNYSHPPLLERIKAIRMKKKHSIYS
ncbi:MAG: M48 family metallopeptidase [Treponema sp.]|nr:M48 family metallopeptidase [Treponema sp.]